MTERMVPSLDGVVSSRSFTLAQCEVSAWWPSEG